MKHIEYVEDRIEQLKEHELETFDYSPNYAVWLIAMLEYVFSEVRQKAAMTLDDPEYFDVGYRKLVAFGQNHLSKTAHEYLWTFESMRNVLIHKGFPNAYEAPMIKDPERHYAAIDLMRSPRSYFDIKDMKQVILTELNGLVYYDEKVS
ncbi:hypothetical protein ACEV8Q_22355 [Vibrio parahaemolyticus]|uniref:hypothetical protein n=1 Tax=Vibrio parahaemolyticus TaxID=670 RepID=UPI0012AE908C|nr:hypothetical protein [Vibrio parahaemolyticus]ELI5382319.1 hypothetical protein [Vibrio parahaemolyticus]